MFELVCVAFAAAYVAPVFLIENAIRSFNEYVYLDWALTAQALKLVLVGVSAMIGGFYLLPRSPLGRFLPQADLPLEPRQFTQFLWLAFGLAGGLRLVERLTLASWGRGLTAAFAIILSHVMAIGIALLAYRAYRVDVSVSRGRKLLLFGVITATSAMGLGGGMLEAAFIPLVVVFIARWHASGRLPVSWILLGSVAFILLNTAKYEYRSEVWYSSKEYSFAEQFDVWASKVTSVVASLTTSDGVETAFARSISRLDLIHTFAHVIALTPGYLPHYDGSSYDYLLYGWIPRILWPNKPIAQEASVMFALDYGLLLDSQTDTTMIGIGFLSEAYANFGLIGIVGVMFLIGSLFGIAHVMFNGVNSDAGRAVYIAVLAFYLNGIGSSTAMFVFFGIQGFIALPLILRFFAGRWRAPVVAVQPALGPQGVAVGSAP